MTSWRPWVGTGGKWKLQGLLWYSINQWQPFSGFFSYYMLQVDNQKFITDLTKKLLVAYCPICWTLCCWISHMMVSIKHFGFNQIFITINLNEYKMHQFMISFFLPLTPLYLSTFRYSFCIYWNWSLLWVFDVNILQNSSCVVHIDGLSGELLWRVLNNFFPM